MPIFTFRQLIENGANRFICTPARGQGRGRKSRHGGTQGTSHFIGPVGNLLRNGFRKDSRWNPAVENQATDRAFRVGQKRNVVVHKFIIRGTVEEKIDALIQNNFTP